MTKFYLLFYFILIHLNVFAQKVNIHFQFTWNGTPIELEQNYFSPNLNDSIQFETLKFYLSDIQLLNNNQCVSKATEQHHLIDIEQLKSITIPSSKPFNQISFKLGIDSTTNVSGAFGGDLDPTNGMYWTWQSGYINFKIEGYSPSCPARKGFFQYHIGGYLMPYYPIQIIQLPVHSQENIIIEIKLHQFFESTNVKEIYEVMSPNATAMKIAPTFAQTFRVKK